MALNPEDEQAFQDIADSLRLELSLPEIEGSVRHDNYIHELARMILSLEKSSLNPKLVEEFIGRVTVWGRGAEEADAQVASEILEITGSILHISDAGIPDTVTE